MLVNYYKTINESASFEVKASNIKEMLMLIKAEKGKDYTDNIINNQYKYILIDSSKELEPIALMPDVIFSEISGYDTVLIVPQISGEGAAIVAAVAGAAFAATGAGLAIAAVINIAISIAISAIVSLLSPTPEFTGDPSQAQLKQSSLFNGAPLIREQGGIVPIVSGNPFCGGVLISSGLSTEEIVE